MNILAQLISWVMVLSGSLIPTLFIIFVIGLAGLQEITRFERGNSFFYRLNPVTKFFFLVSVIVLISTTIWWISAIFSVFILSTFLTLKNGVKRFFYALFLFISSILGGTWNTAPFLSYEALERAFPGQNFTVIWIFPSYFTLMGYDKYLTLQALYYGLQVSFRVAPLLLSGLLFVMTTDTSQILRMFYKLKFPIPFTFSITVGIRTVPKIFELLDMSIKMQYMRGLGYGKPRVLLPFVKVYAIFLALIPTIVYLFKGAKNMGISAATRGFMAYNKRTNLVCLTFTNLDYYFFVIIALIITVSILANTLGFGRTIATGGGIG